MALEGANTALETVRFMGLAWLFPVSLGQILDLEYYFLTVLDLDTNLEFASTNVTYPVETLPLTPCCSLVTARGNPAPALLVHGLGELDVAGPRHLPGLAAELHRGEAQPGPGPQLHVTRGHKVPEIKLYAGQVSHDIPVIPLSQVG